MGGNQSLLKKNILIKTDETKDVQVEIDYCGSWGYLDMANDVQSLIAKYYPKAKLSAKVIPGYSGFFEVMVNKKLVHSKKNGEGYVTDPQEFMDKVKKVVENQ